MVVPDLVDDTFETESEFSEAPGPQPDERDRSAGDFRIGNPRSSVAAPDLMGPGTGIICYGSGKNERADILKCYL